MGGKGRHTAGPAAAYDPERLAQVRGWSSDPEQSDLLDSDKPMRSALHALLEQMEYNERNQQNNGQATHSEESTMTAQQMPQPQQRFTDAQLRNSVKVTRVTAAPTAIPSEPIRRSYNLEAVERGALQARNKFNG